MASNISGNLNLLYCCKAWPNIIVIKIEILAKFRHERRLMGINYLSRKWNLIGYYDLLRLRTSISRFLRIRKIHEKKGRSSSTLKRRKKFASDGFCGSPIKEKNQS